MSPCHPFFVKGPRRLSWIFWTRSQNLSIFASRFAFQGMSKSALLSTPECGAKSPGQVVVLCAIYIERLLQRVDILLVIQRRINFVTVYLTFCHVLSTSSSLYSKHSTCKIWLFHLQCFAIIFAMLCNAWIADGYRFDDRKLAVPGDSWNAHSIQGWRLGEPNISKLNHLLSKD